LYTGELNLTEQPGLDILGLLIASDELLLEELFKHIQDYLIKTNIDWVKQNFILIFHTISKLTNCKKLQDYCLENPQLFFTSKDFPSLDKDTLFELLKRDDLQVEEIKIWDCLIKWGVEQTPGLESGNSDRAKWNQENFETLKMTLNQFIPLIRFMEISSADFFDKICLYKAVIPHHIFKEVVQFYHKGTLPKMISMKYRIASSIIKPILVAIIANWIDKNDSTVFSLYLKYKFNLIYKERLII